MSRQIRIAVLIGLCSLVGQWGWSQQRSEKIITNQNRTQRPTNTGGEDDVSQMGFDDQLADEVDTFGVFFYYANNPNRETPFSDSLLAGNFHQYDPIRQRDFDYMHLGIVGSAHRPILYEPAKRRGFDVGLHQYDLYMKRAQETSYYRLEKPYTNVHYTQGGEQADGIFKAQFSRNFANGINYGLEYNKISYIGSGNQYPNQNHRMTTFINSMSYESEKGKYRAYFSMASNTGEAEDNGGVSVEPEKEGQFKGPASAQTLLGTGQTRHQHQEFSYTHYLKFGGGEDSIRGELRSYTLSHQVLYNTSKYKFFEEGTTADTAFFSRYPDFLVDDRGSRFYLRHRKLENVFNLSTFKLGKSDQENEAKKEKDLLQFGLVHSLHWLDYEPNQFTINNLFLTGKITFNPSERLFISTDAHFGLLENRGDYKLSGELFFDLKQAGNLTVRAVNQLYSPNLLQDQLLISQRPVWENAFRATLETNITAAYYQPLLDITISGGYHLINNFIYFDQTGQAKQTGVPISVTQLMVQKDFTFGKFHLDNTIALQQSTETFIRVPTIYSKHSLYYAGKWFNVLNVRWGVDMRFNTEWDGYYYNPFSGQFQLSDQKIDAYPNVDGFFSMRIGRFRAFFKYENLSLLLLDRQLYYQTASYPNPFNGFRFGINWRFIN